MCNNLNHGLGKLNDDAVDEQLYLLKEYRHFTSKRLSITPIVLSLKDKVKTRGALNLLADLSDKSDKFSEAQINQAIELRIIILNGKK